MGSIFANPINTSQGSSSGSIFANPITTSNYNQKPTVTPTPTPVQKTQTKLNLGQKISNTFENIVKGITLSFKAPAVSKPLPSSVFKQTPAVNPAKPVQVTPTQKKLTDIQLQTVVGKVVNKIASAEQSVFGIKLGTLGGNLSELGAILSGASILPETYKEYNKLDPWSKLNEATKVMPALIPMSGVVTELKGAKNLASYIRGFIGGYGINSVLKFAAQEPKKRSVLEAIKPSIDNIIFGHMIGIVGVANPFEFLKKQPNISKAEYIKSRDFLKDLGVKEEVFSKPEALKKSYFNLAKKYHPDMKGGNAEIMTKINNAYKIVKDTFYDVAKTGDKQNITGLLGDGEHTPQEVIGTVIKNNLEKTPEGKALIKAALEAQKTGQNIVVAKTKPIIPKEGSYFKEAGTYISEKELEMSSKEQINLVVKGKKPAYAEDYASMKDAKDNLKYMKKKGLLIGYDKFSRLYGAKTQQALDRVIKSGNAGAGFGFIENWNPEVEREHGLALGYKDMRPPVQGGVAKELKGKITESVFDMGGVRKHTSGKVNFEDLKVLPYGLETAKETFKNQPLFKISKEQITVGVDINTGEKQLLDGYHRYLYNKGKGTVNARFLPMKNGDIIDFNQVKSPSVVQRGVKEGGKTTPPLTSSGGSVTMGVKGDKLLSNVLNADNQLSIDGRKLNTAQIDALNSILKANGKSEIRTKSMPIIVSGEELKMAVTAHPQILQNAEIQRALNVAQQKTSNLPTSNLSLQGGNINGQLPFAKNTTTPLTKPLEPSGSIKIKDVSPAENINGGGEVEKGVVKPQIQSPDEDANKSLLTSEQAKQVESQDTAHTKAVREQIDKLQEDITQRRQENEVKKSILDQFNGKQIKAMRAIKNSIAIRVEKGLDPITVSETKSFVDHIADVMAAIGTDSTDEALRFIQEDLPDKIINANTNEQLKQIEVLKTHITPKEVGVPKEQLPVGEGKLKVSKLEARMKGVIGNATQEQIDNLGLSTYQTMNKAEQITKASTYVVNNQQEALDVLRGKVEPPKGIIPESIYIAMTELAKDDITLATKLSSLSATALGQRISILSEINKDNPVRLLNEVYKVRAKAVEKRFGKNATEKVVKSIKEKVKVPDKWDWNNFINSIDTC